MPNATFLVYSNKDVINTIWSLAFQSNYPPHPSNVRRQVSTVYMAASSTLLHQILQMSSNDRMLFAIDFCDYMPGSRSATALGLESIFFTLASDPQAATVLFNFAPLGKWLGNANADASDRSAGAAFIDLAHPERGALFSKQKISAMMQGGSDYTAIVAQPDALVSKLFARSNAIIRNPGTSTVGIYDVADPINQLIDPDANPIFKEDDLEAAVQGFDVQSGHWRAGTWGKAFTALGAICAAGALIATGVGAPAGLWVLNAALFGMDAAIMNFADAALNNPSLSYVDSPIPDLPEEVVTVEMRTATSLHIDDAPDVTPPQPP
jgi:hypothetical protein